MSCVRSTSAVVAATQGSHLRRDHEPGDWGRHSRAIVEKDRSGPERSSRIERVDDHAYLTGLCAVQHPKVVDVRLHNVRDEEPTTELPALERSLFESHALDLGGAPVR